jgi:preprotein translocase subunit SecY
MKTFFSRLRLAFKDANLRKRIGFVFFAFALYRVLANVPIPGVSGFQIERLLSDQFFGLFNVFSGGGLANLSIVMLGVGPYITAAIIMQLLTILSPKIKALYTEEGEAGRKKFNQWSRLITVPLAFIQAVGFLTLLQRQGIIDSFGGFEFLLNTIIIAAGSMLLMWIGELMSEFGIGNGVSLIIFGGIVATLPTTINNLIFSYTPADLPLYLAFLAIGAIVTLGVVFITEAERPIPVTYAKQVRGNRVYGGVSTYLPLRLNQAGVIPIIFAVSILLFPQVFISILTGFMPDATWLVTVSDTVNNLLANSWVYGIIYFLLIVFFTYFYTAITFDPHNIAENLQRGGAFVPGVRPGEPTAEHIGKIISRLTLFGASFLGLIAVLPVIITEITGRASLTIGGIALLIAVSVIIDLVRKIDAQISVKEY